MLFERTALSKRPDELARKELDALRKDDQLTPDMVFRDPYFLQFTNSMTAILKKILKTQL